MSRPLIILLLSGCGMFPAPIPLDQAVTFEIFATAGAVMVIYSEDGQEYLSIPEMDTVILTREYRIGGFASLQVQHRAPGATLSYSIKQHRYPQITGGCKEQDTKCKALSIRIK